jgi:signal transduction histidine kinase
MRAGSLRLTWILIAVFFVGVALAAAGVIIAASFQHALDRERATYFEASINRLAAQIDPGKTPPLSGDLLDDPRYDTPLSGVYWQVEDLGTGEVFRSRSLWDGALEPLHDDLPTVVRGPNDDTLIAVTRTIAVEGDSGAGEYRFTIAQPHDDPARAASKFGSDIVLALSAVALAFATAVFLQIWLSIRPLRRMLAALEAVRAGRATRLEGTYPSEVQPLATALNGVLTVHEQMLQTARHRAADLAHGLQTPIAVLRATAERMRALGDRANADTIEMLTTEMSERVSYQLKVARLRTPTGTRHMSSSLNDTVLRSVAVLRKTAQGQLLNWRLDLLRQIDVDLDGTTSWSLSASSSRMHRNGPRPKSA